MTVQDLIADVVDEVVEVAEDEAVNGEVVAEVALEVDLALIHQTIKMDLALTTTIKEVSGLSNHL